MGQKSKADDFFCCCWPLKTLSAHDDKDAMRQRSDSESVAEGLQYNFPDAALGSGVFSQTL